jgi:predicted nucleic acid-binding protein
MAFLPSRVVIDANIAINWLLGDLDFHKQSQALLSDCAENSAPLIVPPTFHTEVDSAIRRIVHLGKLSIEDGEAAYSLFDRLPVTAVMNAAIRRRAREIATQLNQPRVYDSTYTALAEAMDCEFWTADRRFVNAAQRLFPFVRFIGDY